MVEFARIRVLGDVSFQVDPVVPSSQRNHKMDMSDG